MKREVTHYLTGKPAKESRLLRDIHCTCDKGLHLVRNDRADASYKYLVLCDSCSRRIAKIGFDNKVTPEGA